jgi:hypothetical protein
LIGEKNITDVKWLQIIVVVVVTVAADYAKNTKKLLTTQHQDVSFWQRMNT